MREISPDTKIALVGAGAMGSAILKGWINSSAPEVSMLSADNFYVVEPTISKAQELEGELGVKCFATLTELLNEKQIDIAVMAVKPQVLDAVLDEFAAGLTEQTFDKAPLVISIAAGFPTQKIESTLPDGIAVVRVMPNLPLQISSGASVVAAGKSATNADAQFVCDLFSSLGFASIVDEAEIDAVCAISGGGPAYFAYMIEALTQAGKDAGLDEQLAEQLAIATMKGTALMLDSSEDEDAGQQDIDTSRVANLRKSVCSPNGTTLAALGAMDEGNFTDTVKSGIVAAIKRAEELAQ